VEPAGILEPLRFSAFTDPYKALLTNAQEVASLRGESSNQLLDILGDWNVYLERNADVIGLIGQASPPSLFPLSFYSPTK
jgi:hypothetical protein